MENRIELGSEFNLSPNALCKTENNLFYYLRDYKTQWFDYGRSAIRHIPIQKEKTVLLPEFICESVTNCFPKEHISFYRIDDQFLIDVDDLVSKVNEDTGCIYLAHYFGFLQEANSLKIIRQLADRYQITVIEDTTQSLFSPHALCGDYALASVRKWMPLPMGGVLYSSRKELPDCGMYRQNCDNSRVYGMILKDMFLKMGYDTNEKYREIFENAEQMADTAGEVRLISDFARFAVGCVDIAELVSKRKANAARLEKGLREFGISMIRQFSENECPLALPLRINNRDNFRRYLIQNRIYCAVHWPFDGLIPEERPNGQYNSKTLISMPIDQRYGETEIDYMIEVIRKYGGDLSF